MPGKEPEPSSRLTRKQKIELQRISSNTDSTADNPSRRKFFGVLAGGAVVLAGGGSIIAVGKHLEEQAKVNSLIKESREKEAQIEPLIQVVEDGFANFIFQTNQLIEKTDLPEDQKKALQIPFKIFAINTENPDRNFYSQRRKALERNPSSGTKQTMGNSNFYFYDFLNPKEGINASFAPLFRTLQLSPKYDPKNLLDNFIIMHELVHVAQDNVDRQTIPASARTTPKEI